MCFQLCAKGTGYKFRFLNKTMFLVALILIDDTFILEFCASSRSSYTNSKRFSCKPTAVVLSLFHPSVFSLLTRVTIPVTECIRVKQVERSTNLFPYVWTISWSRAVKLMLELQVAFFVVISIVIKEFGL